MPGSRFSERPGQASPVRSESNPQLAHDPASHPLNTLNTIARGSPCRGEGVGVAWMRMMGADSVAYHRETIIERGDDFPGATLEYYASRGETPLAWGGSGAASLGLFGAVDNPCLLYTSRCV